MASGLKKHALVDMLAESRPVAGGGLAGIAGGGLLAGVCESIGALSGPTSRHDRDVGNDIAALARSGPSSLGLG